MGVWHHASFSAAATGAGSLSRLAQGLARQQTGLPSSWTGVSVLLDEGVRSQKVTVGLGRKIMRLQPELMVLGAPTDGAILRRHHVGRADRWRRFATS